MAPNNEQEARIEEIVDERLDKYGVMERNDEPATHGRVTRRTALGLAGLLGVGGLVGVGSAQESAGLTLDGPLEVGGNPIEGINNVQASHNYPSIKSNGTGGTVQLFDADYQEFFLRAAEDPEREKSPGPIMFNGPITGVPDDVAGTKPEQNDLHIDDDTNFNSHDLKKVGSVSGSVTDGKQLDSLTGANLAISDGQLETAGAQLDDATRDRLDAAVSQLEAVGGTGNAWRAGPTTPTGKYHANGAFGIVLETEAPTYLGECRIAADATGQLTPALYEYDLDSRTLGERVDEITIQATGDVQTIFLDFLIDDPGQYLLTRLIPESRSESDLDEASDSSIPDDLWRPDDDPVALRRAQNYVDWASDSQDGVTVPGAHNPSNGAVGSEVVDYWYYYFDLELSTPSDA